MPLELPDGWRDQLPDDIKDNGVLDDVSSIDQMATMIVNARKLQSTQISVPSADTSPEKKKEFLDDLQTKVPELVYVGEGADMSNIYDRMGRPKEATGYELGEIPDPLKDNMAKLAEKAHGAGVTNAQMKAITETIVGDFNENVDSVNLNLDESKAELKKEYGEAYDSKVKLASEFAKQAGFDATLVDAIGAGEFGLGNMKALDKVMEGFESPGPRIGDVEGDQEFGHLTPAQAREQLDAMLNDKGHAYWDAGNPGHDDAVKKSVELNRAILAGQTKTESEQFRDALMGRG